MGYDHADNHSDLNIHLDAERLEQIASKYGIKLILLYGSAVGGTLHAHSDLDVGVLFYHLADLRKRLFGLWGEIEELVAGREIDLAVINTADPLFLAKIVGNCRLLYGQETALYELKLYAFKRFQDHRRFLQMERDYVRRIIKHMSA